MYYTELLCKLANIILIVKCFHVKKKKKKVMPLSLKKVCLMFTY